MEPELASVEAFVEWIVDNDRETFTFDEAKLLAESLDFSTAAAIRAVKDYGLRMETRPTEKKVRGFRTSSQDRWYGPGSSPTHGGSGWEQITGFGGQEG